ncbi:Panacea domain-containing protein [Sphingomonas faeni]|uniref:Panacea domain-containing protein n=1 Tax=Sphingomonas faeni TaxID=185950 RepID=UPI002413ABE0|nr:type II toxin-antitoxin system antitoxin SocA domain-containing protein [Sphingomonas faeni]
MTIAPAMTSPPPSTAAAVSNEFLALSAVETGAPAIDQMKLQKLLFYSHAWHLAYDQGALFENDIEAWPWGPVVRDVYVQTRDYGRGPVTSKLWEFGREGDAFNVIVPNGVSDALKPFIRSVWDSLKGYTGIQLSNSTHAPGEPWTIIAEKVGTGSKPIIPNELIAEVFKRKLP